MKHLNVFNSVSEYNSKKDFLKKPYVTYIAENKGLDMNDNVKRVVINNQDKSVDITENGSIELFADGGYTGLGKVIVNTNVASGGGSDMPVIGDGKTYLYIEISNIYQKTVKLYLTYYYEASNTKVIIDWGDGGETQTLSGTAVHGTHTHTYDKIGKYVISLDVTQGDLVFGNGSTDYGILGYYSGTNSNAPANILYAIEIGTSLKRLSNYSFGGCIALNKVIMPSKSFSYVGTNLFQYCRSLKDIDMPLQTGVTDYMFQYCHNLINVNLGNNISYIGKCAFFYCQSLMSIIVPPTVRKIYTNAFSYCSGLRVCDFSQHTSVPTLESSAFTSIYFNCKIVVPDSLYDTWIAATNWSLYASMIVKASEFNA